MFSDIYAQQSCTAGRAAFITGQSPFRTGLLKVGLPGAKEGLSDKDPTLAELLKPQGYSTGQFGKNHLGDRNEFLPTVHGFDEFFGNLYHLNAEEEPENPAYPKPPEFPNFKARFGPRGVLHTFASDKDDPSEDARFGRVGTQFVVGTPLGAGDHKDRARRERRYDEGARTEQNNDYPSSREVEPKSFEKISGNHRATGLTQFGII
jgi:arylsulfatase